MTFDRAGGPLRTALYMPASNARAIEKAKTLACDAVILDLEDAVGPEDKAAARAAAAGTAARDFGERTLVIRINALSTPWGREDLAAALKAEPDAVLVPKLARPAEVEELTAAMAEAPRRTRLWIMVETAAAVLGLAALAQAGRGERLAGLVFGPNDLALETGARMTADREPLRYAMQALVLSARAFGLLALDGPYGDIADLEGLERECRQARDFGFDGKSLIHPSHLDPCNRAFSPDPEEIRRAQAVAEAFARPENAGKGAIRVEGRMAERLHLAMAERTLAQARRSAAP